MNQTVELSARTCIYCGGRPLTDEHWLPACFGRFNYELLKGRICEACNGRRGLGALDEEVIRTGPEGIMRALRGIQGRRGDASVNPAYFRAASTQPVRITAADPAELQIVLEPFHENGHARGRPARQIALEDESGARHYVPINLAWTSDVLKSALASRGCDAMKLVEVYIDPDEVDVARTLLSPLFPGFVADSYSRDGELGTKRVKFQNTIGADYMRGLAKIGFHYALKFLPDVRGGEDEFRSVREFIRSGTGNVDDFVRDGTGTFSFVPAKSRPIRWLHFLAVESSSAGVLVRLQLFVGPDCHPIPWVVRLSSVPVGTSIARGHVAVYFEDAPRPDADGELHELQVVTEADPI